MDYFFEPDFGVQWRRLLRRTLMLLVFNRQARYWLNYKGSTYQNILMS
jgi:hypothetical protein